jgi:hypothetical protein
MSEKWMREGSGMEERKDLRPYLSNISGREG